MTPSRAEGELLELDELPLFVPEEPPDRFDEPPDELPALFDELLDLFELLDLAESFDLLLEAPEDELRDEPLPRLLFDLLSATFTPRLRAVRHWKAQPLPGARGRRRDARRGPAPASRALHRQSCPRRHRARAGGAPA